MFSRLFLTISALMLIASAMLVAPMATAQTTTDVPPPTAGPPPPPSVAPPVVTPSAPASPVTLNEGYVLGAGDVVEVAVLGREDYRSRVQVQVDGSIQLPLIGDLTAANRTVLQLRGDVRSALVSGGYFTDPAVSVSVASFASRYLTVLGEVATPGLVPIDRSYRLSEILARVGGTRASAADDITLTRVDGTTQNLNMRDVATGAGDADPIVNPGDRIFVAVAPQFFIYGQINAPGSYRVDRNMTLRMALARGGGLTTQGSERRVKIFRNGEELRNFDPNGLIQGGDTVVVGERFF
jgi:polysaccharide biosynthesis/export protein